MKRLLVSTAMMALMIFAAFAGENSNPPSIPPPPEGRWTGRQKFEDPTWLAEMEIIEGPAKGRIVWIIIPDEAHEALNNSAMH